jgi:hypothetical protein
VIPSFSKNRATVSRAASSCPCTTKTRVRSFAPWGRADVAAAGVAAGFYSSMRPRMDLRHSCSLARLPLLRCTSCPNVGPLKCIMGDG